MKPPRSITIDRIPSTDESIIIRIKTKNVNKSYEVPASFTGKFEFEFNQGGLSAVLKQERLRCGGESK